MTRSYPLSRRQPHRGLIAGLLLALALGGVGQAPTARAAPDLAAQTATLTASPASLTICKGQTAKVKLTARLQTARTRGSRPSRQPPLASSFTAESGTSYASVSPYAAEVTSRSNAQLTFSITGNSVGNAVIRFEMNPPGEDELVPLVGPPRAAVLVPVKVTECKYLLVLVSKWNIARAWNYDLSSALVAELVPDANGSFAAGTGKKAGSPTG